MFCLGLSSCAGPKENCRQCPPNFLAYMRDIFFMDQAELDGPKIWVGQGYVLVIWIGKLRPPASSGISQHSGSQARDLPTVFFRFFYSPTTLSTSSIVVIPSSTFKNPSCLSVIMPCACANSCISETDGLFKINFSNWGLLTSIS